VSSASPLVIHHLRKGAAEVDPFEQLSGTMGLSGAADTVLIIRREGQGATLYGRGRDVEEIESAIEFDRGTCRWKLLGDAAEVRLSGERQAIIKTLREVGEAMSSRDIAGAIGMPDGNVRYLLFKMTRDGQVAKAGRGRYRPVYPPNNANSPTTPTANNNPIPPPPY
jgi:hypothetical protein